MNKQIKKGVIMVYTELKSLYYEDEEKYEKEYSERISSKETVLLDFNIKNNQAFFVQNSEVYKLAYDISKLDKEIIMLCNKLPGIALNQYSNKCLIDEIVVTNKIEGVNSSRKEISEVLDTLEMQSKVKGKQARFFGLVNQYKKLIGEDTINLNNCKDIRGLYDEVILNEVIYEDPLNKPDGILFRKKSVSVRSATDKIIHSGLMPEEAIIESMEKALAFLNDDKIERLFKVCIFHYLLEYIHPFYDGNGRLGRIILSYGLSKELSPIVAFRISETIKENINKYYKAFKTTNDSLNLGDLTPFLIMMLNMIYDAMVDLKEALKEKLLTWLNYEKIISDSGESINKRMLYSFLTQAALFSEKGISMLELTNHMKCSKYVVNKLLSEIDMNMIVIKKKSNIKFYSLDLEKLNNSKIKI